MGEYYRENAQKKDNTFALSVIYFDIRARHTYNLFNVGTERHVEFFFLETVKVKVNFRELFISMTDRTFYLISCFNNENSAS